MPRSYARNHPCRTCGAANTVGRRNADCPTCRATNRAAYDRVYQRTYHALHRPAPVPRAQSNPDLPREGEIEIEDDGERVRCHVCGRAYRSLVMHIRRHGLDADRYKERFGLARTASLLAPATAERQRQSALARGLGEQATSFLPRDSHRPKGLDNRLGSRVRMSASQREGRLG